MFLEDKHAQERNIKRLSLFISIEKNKKEGKHIIHVITRYYKDKKRDQRDFD